jgi:hypothetical protein
VHAPSELSKFNDVDFQDMMWAFFQNCWHLKDWIKNDPLLSDAVRTAIDKAAHDKSSCLKMCRELCNGTKHLGERPGASHRHINTTIRPGAGPSEMDCVIDNGQGQLISGKKLAADCLAEWERILQSLGLSI